MSTSELLTVTLVSIGAFFFLSGTLGLLRFPDTLCRMHTLTKADNVGIGLICAGMAVHDGTLTGIAMLTFIWMIVIVNSTVSALLIAGLVERSPAERRSSQS